MCKLVVIFWRTWFKWNQSVHSKILLPLEDIVGWATAMLENLKASNAKLVGQKREHHRWKPPDNRMLKLNTDAVVHINKGKSSLGMVLHDHGGVVNIAGLCLLSKFYLLMLSKPWQLSEDSR
ncbi:conserved hypothetical protein [Ricinus communis]|uniref:RNase H type-1 domain-containing protein n=1 Tax=Ricinus communis TaxID=3988 RepID=B9T1P3_RICCO|nr:conserved hypothetical protein [Ricinus communis]